MLYIIISSISLHNMPESVLINICEMCKIHNKMTSVSLFLPDATMSQQEICMMGSQVLTNVKAIQAWFGKTGYTKGGNQGLSKHASKMQTERTGSQGGFGMVWRRDSWMRSLQIAWGQPCCHFAPSEMFPGHRDCWRVTLVGKPLDHHASWALTVYDSYIS